MVSSLNKQLICVTFMNKIYLIVLIIVQKTKFSQLIIEHIIF